VRPRSESTLAIWLACVGIGLLFLARGAFQPYIFPLFEHLAGLPYAKIAPRLAHDWLPDRVTFETPELDPDVVEALTALGHTAARSGPRPQGDAHTVWVPRPHTYVGVADRRRSEAACAAGH
jgi:hypothetical protein